MLPLLTIGVLWIGLTTISIIPNEDAYWKEMMRITIAAAAIKSPSLEGGGESKTDCTYLNGDLVSG